MKKIIVISLFIFTAFLGACRKPTTDSNTLRVGTIAGPESSLLEAAKSAAKRDGLILQIIEFSDFSIPNAALQDGSIDANMFQHEPFLQAEIKHRGYKLTVLGKMFIYPLAAYSHKIKSFNALPDKAIVAIPNDPSNEARALLLLQKNNLIKLREHTDLMATVQDIIENPKHLQFKELDAAQLPRILADVDLAVINTNYAIPAGLNPQKDALMQEDSHSPYVNIVATREGEQDKLQYKKLMLALHSPEVLAAAEKLFQGSAIRGW